jgi:hypothetical protein
MYTVERNKNAETESFELGTEVHACNPSYSEGRDRRILNLRPRPYLKNKIQTKGLRMKFKW